VAEIGEGSDDAVVSQPEFSLAKRTISASTSGAMRGRPVEAELGAVEFAGNQPPVPGEDGIGFGDTGGLLKRRTAETLTGLSKG
jgi:hypothetical protein